MASPPPLTIARDLTPVSSLCTTGHPANVLTGVFVRLLREHFMAASNLEFNGVNTLGKRELEQYLWVPNAEGDVDVERSRIQIDAVWKYNSQDIQNRPALYVKRNPFQYQQLALNHGWVVNPMRSEAGEVSRIPGEIQSVAVMGSHTIFCVGGTGAEAELLGQEVSQHLVGFASVLRADLELHKLLVTEVGEVAVLDESQEHFVVPVVIGYIAIPTWRINAEAPWLKTIAIDTRAK